LQELIAALSALLQNLQLRRQIGQAARRTILHSLTTTHQADQLAALYRECVA
jgi:glycosyltransferase involved in cell wall biosynthesis